MNWHLPELYFGGVLVGAVLALVVDLAQAERPRTILRDVLILPWFWPLAIALYWWVRFRRWGMDQRES